jgi:PAS domain S-box-containing protein
VTIDFERFCDRSDELMCVSGPDGMLDWVNRRCTEVLGWSAEELKSRRIASLVHPDDVRVTRDARDRLTAGEPVVRLTNRYRCKDGSYRWLEWSVRVDGTRWYGVARDVTDHGARDVESLQQLRMWDLAATLANIGYWMVDIERNEVTWSKEVFRIHGLDPSGSPLPVDRAIEAYHPDDRPLVQALVRRAMETGEPFRFKLRLLRADDAIRHVQSHGVAVFDDGGAPIRLFGVFRDVTDDPGVVAMNDFAYIVSHDLMEPVRTVQTFLDLVRTEHDDALPDAVREYLDIVASSGARMGELLEALRRYTRLGGRVPVEPVDPAEVARETLEDLAAHVSENDASVRIDPLPRVLCNPVRLRLVFSNLFNNSLRYRSDAPPAIRVEGTAEGPNVQIRVTDNGIGIAPAMRERVFQVFRTLHPRGTYEGTGIGLAIVKRIVEQSAGRVWLEAAPDGVGSTVVIELPAAP